MARVSVGLPVYNGENYVGYAIESVLTQTFTDWELVISDNASTDRTVEICQAFAKRDSRIKLLIADQNRGAAWNFNHVFHQSSGHYFRWLSHDDWLMPESLAECVRVMDSRPELSACATRTGAIDESGYRILDNLEEESDFACQSITQHSEAMRKTLISSCSVSDRHRGVLLYSRRCNEVYGLVRRDLFRNTQMHPSYCGGEKVLLAELALHGPIYEIDRILFFVRWHAARFTSNNSTLEQQKHMASPTKRGFSLPHQYRATLGYLALLGKVKMSVVDRIKCFAVWIRFTLQLSKWAPILANTIAGRAARVEIAGETRRGARIHELKSFCTDGSSPRSSSSEFLSCHAIKSD